MIERFICESCELEFDNKDECEKHETQCQSKATCTCFKCGKTESWIHFDDPYLWIANGWHTINLGRIGYGSRLDGCDVEFMLCDSCLIEFINSFTLEGQEKVINSGSNMYMSTEEWIENKQKFESEESKNA